MIDPAALGTLLIGLDHVRAEHEVSDTRPAAQAARPHRLRAVARPLAASLRRLADALEPNRTPELGLEP